jgi:hypothetical protein
VDVVWLGGPREGRARRVRRGGRGGGPTCLSFCPLVVLIGDAVVSTVLLNAARVRFVKRLEHR